MLPNSMSGGAGGLGSFVMVRYSVLDEHKQGSIALVCHTFLSLI
jgi:hypothetical protein